MIFQRIISSTWSASPRASAYQWRELAAFVLLVLSFAFISLSAAAQPVDETPIVTLRTWLTTGGSPPRERLRALRVETLSLLDAGNLDSALRYFDARLEVVKAELSREQQAPLFSAVGVLLLRDLQAYARAKPYLVQALAMFEAEDKGLQALLVADALAECHIWLFETQLALEHAFTYRDRAIALGSLRYERIFSSWIARSLDVQGELEEALRHYERVCALSFQEEDPWTRYDALINLASAYYKNHQFSRGLEHISAAYAYTEDDAERVARTQLWEASMHNALGDYSRAGELLVRARGCYDVLGLTDSRVHVRMELARTRQGQGRHQEAVDLVQEAFSIVGDALTPYNELFGYGLLSEAYKSLGEYDLAILNLDRYNSTRATLDSVNRSHLMLTLVKRFELREQQQTIARQQALIAKRWWLGIALALAVVLLLATGVALGIINRNRQLLGAQNRTIAEQAKGLRRVDELKTELFTNVAHELRTPLTLVLLPLRRVLRDTRLDPEMAAQLHRAERSAGDLLGLVNSLLDLARLDEGRMPLDVQPIVLAALLSGLIERFTDTAAAANISFTSMYRAPTDLVVELDGEKLRAILNNLLSNALRATPVGGAVRLETASVGDELVFVVADTGDGIPAEDLASVFERYRQVRPAGTPSAGGSGIGLAVVASYIERMGGQKSVESTPGAGSAFTVRLPMRRVLAEANPGPSQPSTANLGPPITAESRSTTGQELHLRRTHLPWTPESAGAPACRLPRVLVVEDHIELRRTLRELLEPHYCVDTAANGREALDAVATQLPDLIVSDVMMPVMDGYELLRRLKAEEATRPIPVVMLTARTDPQDRREALRIGVDDYLHKPFDADVLLHRIASLLQHRRDRASVSDLDTNLVPGLPLPAASVTSVQNPSTPDLAIHSTPPAPTREIFSDDDLAWLTDFEQYIQLHLRWGDLSVPFLSNAFMMSESTFLRQLKRLTGLTPARYVQKIRLAEARRLLETPNHNLSISDIAARVGYSQVRTFSRNFRDDFGLLPSEYLNRQTCPPSADLLADR